MFAHIETPWGIIGLQRALFTSGGRISKVPVAEEVPQMPCLNCSSFYPQLSRGFIPIRALSPEGVSFVSN